MWQVFQQWIRYIKVEAGGEMAKMVDFIPASAKLQCVDVRNVQWTSVKGPKQEDKCIKEKILVRKQPDCPSPDPQVLVLSDQMLQAYPEPDKCIKCLAKAGYSIKDYTREIQEGGIELSYHT